MTKKYSLQERLGILTSLGVDPERRVVTLTGDVTEESIHTAIFKINMLESLSDDCIELVINTAGGEVTQMWALYDVITASPCPIATVGLGQIASAGVLLLVAGDERYMYPNAIAMVHASTAEVEGTYEGLMEAAKWLLQERDKWCQLMEEHTGTRAAVWRKMVTNQPDRYLTADQCLEMGIVDEIL